MCDALFDGYEYILFVSVYLYKDIKYIRVVHVQCHLRTYYTYILLYMCVRVLHTSNMYIFQYNNHTYACTS